MNIKPVAFTPSALHAHALGGPLLAFVYAHLLRSCLTLHRRDAHTLAALGLDEKSISRLRYRTAPGAIARLVVESEMSQWHQCGFVFDVPSPAPIPGLFSDGQRMRLHVREGSLIVPVADARGEVGALQIYRHARDASPRWFDSSGLPRGARARRQAHFARASLSRQSGGVVIAEHTVAADLHAWANDEGAAAINRLLPDVFARALRQALPGVTLAAFAFPCPDVELLRALHAQGFEVCGQQDRREVA